MDRSLTILAVGLAVPLAFWLFRRFVPPVPSTEPAEDNGRRLPWGVAGLIMCLQAALFGVGGFFLLQGANRLFASLDHNAVLTEYPDAAIWWFLPGFAAITLPWSLTLSLLRRIGYSGQAAEIVADGNAKGGFDCERVMRGLAWGIVPPIALFTLPAVPMHMSVMAGEVRVTHYARLSPEVFRLAEAKKAYMIDGYVLRDGEFERKPDLLIDFADGRRLDANAVGDGGTQPSARLVRVLLEGSNLQSAHLRTAEEIPRSR